MNGLRLPRSGASSSGPNNYMSSIPTTIQPGLCLVHNKVIIGITPRRKPGVQGFRVWLAPHLIRCRSKSAPAAGPRSCRCTFVCAVCAWTRTPLLCIRT